MSLHRWMGVASLVAMGATTVACSGCPGTGGRAEEVPVEIDWPDASTLGPVQAIDPTKPQPVQTEPVADDEERGAGRPPAKTGDRDASGEPPAGDAKPATITPPTP